MTRVQSLRLRAFTKDQAFGADFSFAEGLNIIQADNTSGKSTCLQAIIYALGMERAISTNLSIPLPFVMRERLQVERDGEYKVVLQSYVEVEVVSSTGSEILIRRDVVGGADTKLISTWSSRREDGSWDKKSQRDYFVLDPGAAVREDGFHFFLAQFLGMDLPTVSRFDGAECPLYLETLFNLFFVEQKRGWSTIQGPFPTQFSIQDLSRRVMEFLLDLDAGKIRRQRAELNKRIKNLIGEWQERRRLLDRSTVAQVRYSGVPMTPTAEFAVNPSIELEIYLEDEWLPLTDAIKQIQEEVEELSQRELKRTEEVEPELQRRISEKEKHVDDLSGTYEALRTEFQALIEENRSVRKRLDALAIDLRRNQDALKLQSLGSTIGTDLKFHSCPTCHQDLRRELLPETSPEAMALDQNIAFIKSQQLMYKSSLNSSNEELAGLRVQGNALSGQLNDNRRELRDLKRALVRPSSSVDRTALFKAVRLQSRTERWEELREKADEVVDEMSAIAKEWSDAVTRLKELRTGDDFTVVDKNKLLRLVNDLKDYLKDFGFKSFPADEIHLAADNFRPQVLVRDPDTEEVFEKDLGFEASASDGIRLKWAYYLSLLRLSVSNTTNHPGFVVFDEPGQQEMATRDLLAMLKASSDTHLSSSQIIIATSEQKTAIEAGMAGRDYHIESVEGYILKPISGI